MIIQKLIHQYFYPFYIRRWAERFFKVKSGQVVIDAGAYIGGFTFYVAKKVGKAGRVIAFEPDPKNYQILKRNIENSNFKNIILINKALGNSVKEVELESANHFSSVVIKTSKKPTYKVQQTTIDQEISRLGIQKVDFIKMNIEGAETNAIKGATKTLLNTRYISISCHDVQGENTSLVVTPLLEKSGFDVKVLKRKKLIVDFGHIDVYGARNF